MMAKPLRLEDAGDTPSSEKSTDSPPSAPEPKSWYEAIRDDDVAALDKAVTGRISSILNERGLQRYTTLFLFDATDSISSFHADRLYAAAANAKSSKKDILLFLHSNGGSIEPAYLISKMLKRMAQQKFVVAIPRRAKSAATLITLGADEIHMGMMSQLGPIDPQIRGLPVLALGNALDVIADLTCRFPKASAMFTDYLVKQVPIQTLGYYQRVSESAAQYAERLLAGKTIGEKSPEELGRHLVTHYKDHGFVIDLEESTRLLGEGTVKQGTAEYQAADEIYQFLDSVELRLSFKDKYYWLVGDLSDGFVVTKKKQS